VRNEDQIFPLAKGRSLVVISPKGMLAAVGISERYVSNVIEIPFGYDPSEAEVEQVLQDLSAVNVDIVVLGTVNATHHPGQVQLVTALEDYPSVVIALGLPYDLAALPNTTIYLATYGFSPPSLAVFSEVLVGETEPSGRPPVSIDTEYPVGFGKAGW
jgi:hypothetical protein